MKKYIILILVAALAVFIYNPTYWWWHCWGRWRLSNSEKLYLVPKSAGIPRNQTEKKNWSTVDLLELSLRLPDDPKEIRSICETGIAVSYDDFSIYSVNIVAGRNDKGSLKLLNNAISRRKDLEFLKIESLFHHMTDNLRFTPGNITFFDGRKKTSAVIAKLLIKGNYLRYLKNITIFYEPNVKAIYSELNDGRWNLNLFSPGEDKGLGFMIGFKNCDKKKKIDTVSRIVSSITFGSKFPEESAIKARIEEMAKQGTFTPQK